jgi:hypothetical protein
MGSDDDAIDQMNRPIQLASGFSLLLQDRQEVSEDPGSLPAEAVSLAPPLLHQQMIRIVARRDISGHPVPRWHINLDPPLFCDS